ncbi:MAG TPA: hypothetical protein VIQ11_08260 [Mycobacterium sp.]
MRTPERRLIAAPDLLANLAGDRRFSTGRWIVVVTVGEALGFAFVAAVALFAVGSSLTDPWRYLVLVGAGAVEGAALGAGQLAGMGARRPDPRKWIAATALGATVAWAIGLLPSTLGVPLATPFGISLILVGAATLLASIPVLQWLVIRRRTPSKRWIPVNLGAWAIAILWTFAPSPIVDESTSITVLLAVYTIAGLLMAATVAALTAHSARTLFS